MSTPLTTTEFAKFAGISDQKARRALARASKGFPWRGTQIIVESVRGRGGEAGWSYLVRVDSLPHDLQQRLKEHLRPAALPLFAELTPQRSAEREWWLRILGPLLGMERGSERAAAVEALAARGDLTDWRGQPIVLSTRTIQRRLQAYREQGALAFAPHARADKGHAKVLISLVAETAIPFDDATWENIATELRNYIRGHWKAGVTLKLIRAHANVRFRELLHLHDFTGLCLVFCGNEEVLKRVRTDKGAFAQISRRVPVRTEVNRIADTDADRIASAFGAEGMDAYKLLRAIGSVFHTDGVVSVLETAKSFAGNSSIEAADIRKACELLPHYRSALTGANRSV